MYLFPLQPHQKAGGLIPNLQLGDPEVQPARARMRPGGQQSPYPTVACTGPEVTTMITSHHSTEPIPLDKCRSHWSPEAQLILLLG